MSSAAKFSEKHSGKWHNKESRNGTRVKSKPNFHFQVYCPHCPTEILGGYQLGSIRVSPGARKVTCKNGHTFEVRN